TIQIGSLSRGHRFRASGTIARAAGQLTIQAKFGNTGSEQLIFNWTTGAVTWATAVWVLDIEFCFDTINRVYFARLELPAAVAAGPVPGAVLSLLARGTFSTGFTAGQQNSKLLVLGQFDTSHASNEMALYSATYELF